MYFKVLFAFVSWVQFASSIRCYDCTSANNSMCTDPSLYDQDTLNHFLPTLECNHGIQALMPAGENEFFCRKIVQTIFHKHFEPELRVTRGCGWKRHYKDCYKADNEDHLETVCQCFSDECNGATNVGASLVMGALIFVINYVY